MYSAEIAQKRLTSLVDAVRKGPMPAFDPEPHPIEACEEAEKRLSAIFHPEKGLLRALTPAEQRWIMAEVVLCKADFRYWATRYAKIKTKEQTLSRIAFLESQIIILDDIARLEKAAVEGETGDGVLVAVLKARQLGACLSPKTRVLTAA